LAGVSISGNTPVSSYIIDFSKAQCFISTLNNHVILKKCTAQKYIRDDVIRKAGN
jgi:hypothetical protein